MSRINFVDKWSLALDAPNQLSSTRKFC